MSCVVRACTPGLVHCRNCPARYRKGNVSKCVSLCVDEENKATPAEIKAARHARACDASKDREGESVQSCSNFCHFQAFCKSHSSASLRGHEAHR